MRGCTISHHSRSQATQAGTLGAWCAGSVQMRNGSRDAAPAAWLSRLPRGGSLDGRVCFVPNARRRYASRVTHHPVRAGAWFVLTALLVDGALIAIAALAAMANGEGLSCRDAECGAVSNWFSDAYPFPMIVAIGVSVIAGALMARRRTRT